MFDVLVLFSWMYFEDSDARNLGLTHDDSLDEDDDTRGRAALRLIHRIVIQPELDDNDLPVLCSAFPDHRVRCPGILLSYPPISLVTSFFVPIEWVLSVCTHVPKGIAGILCAGDRKSRGPAHFVAACGKFRVLYEPLMNSEGAASRITHAIETDVHGLLLIHYACCNGTLVDLDCFSNWGTGYPALTHDNRCTVLDLSLASSELVMAE